MLCPRCGQGDIVEAEVVRTGAMIHLCTECEATWSSLQDVGTSPFADFGTYMKEAGLPPLWDELRICQGAPTSTNTDPEHAHSRPISWNAPIVPSVSLANIKLGIDVVELRSLLARHLIDEENSLYQFSGSPILKLQRSSVYDDEIYLFEVHDKALTNWNLWFHTPDHMGVEDRALGVGVRKGKVFFIKIWNFEYLTEGQKPIHVYGGRLPGNIGLGDPLRDLLSDYALSYDDAEEWYYSELEWGALEVSGCGTLEDFPDQRIRSLTLVGEAGP